MYVTTLHERRKAEGEFAAVARSAEPQLGPSSGWVVSDSGSDPIPALGSISPL